MNDTNQSFGSNPASLKGKLQTLEVHFIRILATNQKYLKRTQQSQERSPNPQILKRHSRKRTNNENR